MSKKIQYYQLPQGTNKVKLADELYPDASFDTALPQPWVDAAIDRLPSDITGNLCGQFVWLYDGGLCGRPAPLTQLGVDILSYLSLNI